MIYIGRNNLSYLRCICYNFSVLILLNINDMFGIFWKWCGGGLCFKDGEVSCVVDRVGSVGIWI